MQNQIQISENIWGSFLACIKWFKKWSAYQNNFVPLFVYIKISYGFLFLTKTFLGGNQFISEGFSGFMLIDLYAQNFRLDIFLFP